MQLDFSHVTEDEAQQAAAEVLALVNRSIQRVGISGMIVRLPNEKGQA